MVGAALLLLRGLLPVIWFPEFLLFLVLHNLGAWVQVTVAVGAGWLLMTGRFPYVAAGALLALGAIRLLLFALDLTIALWPLDLSLINLGAISGVVAGVVLLVSGMLAVRHRVDLQARTVRTGTRALILAGAVAHWLAATTPLSYEDLGTPFGEGDADIHEVVMVPLGDLPRLLPWVSDPDVPILGPVVGDHLFWQLLILLGVTVVLLAAAARSHTTRGLLTGAVVAIALRDLGLAIGETLRVTFPGSMGADLQPGRGLAFLAVAGLLLAGGALLRWRVLAEAPD